MNELKIRGSYTFTELLFSLKDYYNEGQNILNEMLSIIDVDTKLPHKSRIWIEQGMATNIDFKEFINFKEEPYDGIIHIDITKKYSPIQVIRELQVVYNDDTPAYYFDNARFILDKTNDGFIFKNKSKSNSKIAYNPKLRIKDIEKFNKLYNRLVNEGYLTYPMMYYFFNHSDINETILTISTNRIELQQFSPLECSDRNRSFILNYSYAEDRLIFKDTRENPQLTISQLLNLPIDKRNIYKEYIPIIENNLNRQEKDIKLLETQIMDKQAKPKVYTKIKNRNNKILEQD